MNIKIGEFSKKHKVTQNTVRHYLNMGLLTANKTGGQYGFFEKDDKDMEEIIKLKQLGFNLNEILNLLTYLRLAGIETEEYKTKIFSMLKNKKEEIEEISKKYEKMCSDIDETIKSFEKRNTETNILGFPVIYLGLLKCPDCKSKLNIKDGIIDNSMLIEGKVTCQCGYHSKVEYGIFIEEKTVRKRILNGNPWPSGEDYLKAVSPSFINFIYSGMSKISYEFKNYDKDSKLVLELQHCVGYFLKHYLKHRSKDSTYILVDYDIDKIIELKKALELNQEHNNFIFLCCEIGRIPLCESSIDIIVDHWMTKDYAHTNKAFVLEKVLPLLKNGGILVGSYPYFKNMKNIKNINMDVLDYFNRDKILEKIEGLGIKQLNSTDIGPVVENNPYNFDIMGKEVYQMIYLGKKQNMW